MPFSLFTSLCVSVRREGSVKETEREKREIQMSHFMAEEKDLIACELTVKVQTVPPEK